MKITTFIHSLLILTCLSSVAHSQENKNLEMLTNPSFEATSEGNITGWGGAAVTSSTDHIRVGQKSLKLTSEKEDYNPYARQEIVDFKLNQNYRLQYHAHAGRFGQDYRVYIGLWKIDPQSGERNWVDGIDAQWRQGLEGWQKVSVDFTITQPADSLMVVLESKGPGTMWFDDISLQPAQEEAIMQPLPPYAGSPKFVQILPDHTYRVKGKPYFPVMLWGWHPKKEEDLAQLRDAGFNSMVSPTHMSGLNPETLKFWLDAAAKYDVMIRSTSWFAMNDADAAMYLPQAIENMKKIIKVTQNHPAFFGYEITDEPAWAGYNLKALAAGAHLFRSLDPNHPIVINHAPRNKISELSRYNRYTDIAGSDIYPVFKTGVDVHSDLPNKTIGVVGDETTKNLEAVDYKKPVMQTLQAFSWSDNSTNPEQKDEPYPSATQLRFMAYHTIVRGATGVSFFQDHRYPNVRPELKSIGLELQSMGDILAAGKTVKDVAFTQTPGLEVLAKEYKGERILIVVNSRAQTVRGKFATGTLPKTVSLRNKLTVIGGKRSVNIVQGTFEDVFEPYAVHIYTTASREAQVLK